VGVNGGAAGERGRRICRRQPSKVVPAPLSSSRFGGSPQSRSQRDISALQQRRDAVVPKPPRPVRKAIKARILARCQCEGALEHASSSLRLHLDDQTGSSRCCEGNAVGGRVAFEPFRRARASVLLSGDAMFDQKEPPFGTLRDRMWCQWQLRKGRVQ